MAKHKYKIGRLVIGGEEYPACINVRVLQQLEDEGIDLDNVLDGGSRRWTNLIYMINCALIEGARLAGADEPPTDEEIKSMIDISDLGDISEQLAVLLGSKGRTVEAEPPKN